MTKANQGAAASIRRRLIERAADERGAVAVLAALLIVVLLAAVAFTIDLSRLYHERQAVQNAMDFGALAGAHELPASDGAAADMAVDVALRVAVDNHTVLDPASVDVQFRCVVGDRDNDGQADTVDIGATCGRRGDTNWMTGWNVKRGKAWHLCNPYGGDLCNTIVLSASRTIPFFFAPVIGINTGSTGAVSAAACRGSCGAVGSPLDVVMVIDRTGSMSSSDLADARAAARSVLELYNPEAQHVGLAALPYGNTSCRGNSTQTYPHTGDDWLQTTYLADDYQNADGSLNTSSEIVQDVNCLNYRSSGTTLPTPRNPAPGITQCNLTARPLPSSTNLCSGETDLGDPLAAAAALLDSEGRPDIPHVILFMTDGEANQPFSQPGNPTAPGSYQPCEYAANAAASAKSRDIIVYTIGFGIAYSPPRNGVCYNDWAGPYYSLNANHGFFASTLLADMASDGPDGTPTTDDAPGSCNTATENNDGDGYFCLPRSEDLGKIFVKAATQALGTSRLLDF